MDSHGVPLFSIAALLTGFCVSATMTVIGFALERRDSSFSRRAGAAFFNIAYLAPASLLQQALMPLVPVAAAAIGGTGEGLIPLPATGWAILPAIAIYLLAMDLGEYLFHRAQHRIPFLWSMHSLHHSDPDLNISTTIRHFWAEHLIKGVTIYLAIGLIFKVSPIIASSYLLASFYNYFLHMNVRIGFGRLSWLLNAPQFHRLHHSRLPHHRDRNFAGLFPVFDYLFGTYRKPQADEFPPTGLDSGERPASVIEALAWPFPGLCRPRATVSAS
jgi:sterol desaturase/sphingolipid hydroxylase (fatty acid hydroxylase superfamily)